MTERNIGDVILKVDNISLSFGVMKVLDDISFDIRQGEIRSIIGPNGAGKSSMLNVINGFYHPQQGSITFKGATRRQMAPQVAASQGIARTFQNIALFKGMSTLDNIMTGRNLKMKTNLFWQALHIGPARTEELENREAAEKIIDFLDIQAIRKKPAGGRTRTAAARRAHGRHEQRGKRRHVPFYSRRQFRVRHHDRID
jgi:branched-chain amino acid transport system ATP-binding protein